MKLYSRKKNSVKIFAAVTLIAAAIFLLSDYFLSKRNEVVVAKIGDEKILKSDIERKLVSVFSNQDQDVKFPEVESLPKEVLELLAKEVYLDKELTKEAKKSGIAKALHIKYKIADAESKILRQAYIDSVLKAEITDKKINEKYLEISNEVAGKKEYLISQIVVKTKEEAEKILKDLKSKKFFGKFAELAKKYSLDHQGAEKSSSYVFEDNLPKEIRDVVAGLKKDEISNPISINSVWYLVKVSDSKDATSMPFESVKDSIRDQLIKDKIDEIHKKITKDFVVKILIKLKEPELIKSSVETEAPVVEPVVNSAEVAPTQEVAPAVVDQAVDSAQNPVVQENPGVKLELESAPKKEQKKSHAKSEKKKSKPQRQKQQS